MGWLVDFIKDNSEHDQKPSSGGIYAVADEPAAPLLAILRDRLRSSNRSNTA